MEPRASNKPTSGPVPTWCHQTSSHRAKPAALPPHTPLTSHGTHLQRDIYNRSSMDSNDGIPSWRLAVARGGAVGAGRPSMRHCPSPAEVAAGPRRRRMAASCGPCILQARQASCNAGQRVASCRRHPRVKHATARPASSPCGSPRQTAARQPVDLTVPKAERDVAATSRTCLRTPASISSP
jgi:hypothetical protein